LFKNIKNRTEFRRQVEILRLPHYEDFELEEFPCCPLGGFFLSRVECILRLVRLHPEYHIVTCVKPSLLVNGFVANGQTYYLGAGAKDPNLVHDPPLPTGYSCSLHFKLWP
jgi:hypothetical protein